MIYSVPIYKLNKTKVRVMAMGLDHITEPMGRIEMGITASPFNV